MWVLSGIGGYELLFLIVASALACCMGRAGRRWLAAVGPLLVVSIVLPGPDLLSMMVTFAVLMLAFTMGIRWAPRLSLAKGQAV